MAMQAIPATDMKWYLKIKAMLYTQTFLSELAKELQVSEASLTQLYYEGELEDVFKTHLIERHLTPNSINYCHHMGDSKYCLDTSFISVDVASISIGLRGFEPKVTTDRGFKAEIQIGNLVLVLGEDDGEWSTRNIYMKK